MKVTETAQGFNVEPQTSDEQSFLKELFKKLSGNNIVETISNTSIPQSFNLLTKE